ncbi:CLUMA_CG014901, isoform A [Clunio marinus]|uniref:CLUMA_CG014901, isoform A n=1 Tax=Clunio marinus TaxID=568069 RepID=A0A1J1IPP0_9DIPT|nr:CLUMA_CG014901, isoform A [Clunio marinus]
MFRSNYAQLAPCLSENEQSLTMSALLMKKLTNSKVDTKKTKNKLNKRRSFSEFVCEFSHYWGMKLWDL